MSENDIRFSKKAATRQIIDRRAQTIAKFIGRNPGIVVGHIRADQLRQNTLIQHNRVAGAIGTDEIGLKNGRCQRLRLAEKIAANVFVLRAGRAAIALFLEKPANEKMGLRRDVRLHVFSFHHRSSNNPLR